VRQVTGVDEILYQRRQYCGRVAVVGVHLLGASPNSQVNRYVIDAIDLNDDISHGRFCLKSGVAEAVPGPEDPTEVEVVDNGL
jgi:hypothetical protein